MVSVVMPVYNAERYVARTIASVRAQTVAQWELLAVDDGSTDRSAQILADAARSDARIRVVRQDNAGIAGARNRGIAEADPAGEFIALLDHDDVWEPDALATLLAALSACPSAVAAHGLARRIGPDDEPADEGQLLAHQRSRRGIAGARLVAWPPSAPTTFSVLAFWDYIITVGQVLIRRSALHRAGPFDPAAVPADDWDMWLRLARLGDIAFVDRTVIGWRSHGSNTSGRKDTMDQATRYVRHKLLAAPDLTPQQRQAAHAGYRCDCTVKLGFARDSLRQGRIADSARQVRRAIAGYARYLRAARAAPPQAPGGLQC